MGESAVRLVGLAVDRLVRLVRFVFEADVVYGGLAEWLESELQRASRELEVEFEPQSRCRSSVAGTCEDFAIRVALEQKDAQGDETQSSTHLCITLSGPRIPAGIAFATDRDTGDDVLTGDTAFDDMVEVRGEPSIVLALLDREIRQRLAEFVRMGGRLKEGRLTSCVRSSFASGELVRSLRLGLWLARELSSPGGGVCERLARNATTDPHPGVRLWNLLQLHEQFAGSVEARAASTADLTDSSPWVALAAARFLGKEGLPVLERLALDRAAPEGAAVEAVALMAARSPAEHAGPLLLTALKTRSGETRRQAIQELGRIGFAPSRGPLIVLLERADPRTAAAAAGALAALHDARAEGPLLHALGSEARELRVAAIRALGAVGTAAAVEPLLAFLESRRLDGETRQAIRDAVAGIQSRLAGAGAGQLSLAATAAGAGWLSVAVPGAKEGELSLLRDRRQAGESDSSS
jgi:HEAT repeat protein